MKKATKGRRVVGVDRPGLFSDDEASAIFVALLVGHHPEPVDEDAMLAALREMERMRVCGTLVDLVLKGKVTMRFDEDGELAFSRAATAVLP